MSTGLPLILCTYSKEREDAYDTNHLLEYGNGLFFPRGDHAALASCIERLVEDATLRKEMGIKSRKLVDDKLNWEKIAKQYIEVYKLK